MNLSILLALSSVRFCEIFGSLSSPSIAGKKEAFPIILIKKYYREPKFLFKIEVYEKKIFWLISNFALLITNTHYISLYFKHFTFTKNNRLFFFWIFSKFAGLRDYYFLIYLHQLLYKNICIMFVKLLVLVRQTFHRFFCSSFSHCPR
jgi:hypothetical protein